jgi:hypothetical protein
MKIIILTKGFLFVVSIVLTTCINSTGHNLTTNSSSKQHKSKFFFLEISPLNKNETEMVMIVESLFFLNEYNYLL